MIAGETDPDALSELAKRKLKSKKAELKRAPNGLKWPHLHPGQNESAGKQISGKTRKGCFSLTLQSRLI
jgi:hypothetical protein